MNYKVKSRLSDRKHHSLHARWHDKSRNQELLLLVLVSQLCNPSDIGSLSGRMQKVGLSYANMHCDEQARGVKAFSAECLLTIILHRPGDGHVWKSYYVLIFCTLGMRHKQQTSGVYHHTTIKSNKILHFTAQKRLQYKKKARLICLPKSLKHPMTPKLPSYPTPIYASLNDDEGRCSRDDNEHRSKCQQQCSIFGNQSIVHKWVY
jgi:hypothetical protein